MPHRRPLHRALHQRYRLRPHHRLHSRDGRHLRQRVNVVGIGLVLTVDPAYAAELSLSPPPRAAMGYLGGGG